MKEYFLKLIETEKAQVVLEYIYQLSPTEVKALIVITVILIAIMTLKWFGVRILFVLLFVYLIAYIIFYNGFIGNYTKRETNYNEHMKMIESYMPDNEVGN